VISLSIDQEADVAVFDLISGRAISRTDQVGRSLLANYDEAGALVSVELLSLAAILRSDVATDLRRLLGVAADLMTSSPAGVRGLNQGFSGRSKDLVDLLTEGHGLNDVAVGRGTLSTV
jgi:Protein of unknown function (DUF2283)